MVATTPPVLLERDEVSLERTPLRYGLFQAASGPFDLPVHARNGGLRYVTGICGEGFGYEIACIDAQADKSGDFGDGSTTVLGAPFMVYASLTCPLVGYTEDELTAMAVERLKGVEQSVVEEVFSTSTFGQSPGLTAADGIITVTGGGTTSAQVLSELERARYCGFTGNTVQYGPRAIVHVPIAIFNDLKERHIIDFDTIAQKWRTPMGTVVSAGCYANNDPAGAAAVDGTFWLYITGQTMIWRTPDAQLAIPPVDQVFNRATNQATVLVEREYVVTYECGGFAKAVTLWP